jgi:hypothetical protein
VLGSSPHPGLSEPPAGLSPRVCSAPASSSGRPGNVATPSLVTITPEGRVRVRPLNPNRGSPLVTFAEHAAPKQCTARSAWTHDPSGETLPDEAVGLRAA